MAKRWGSSSSSRNSRTKKQNPLKPTGNYGLAQGTAPVDTAKYAVGDQPDIVAPENAGMEQYQDWSGTEAVQHEVQDNETVSGQMTGLLDENSDYIKQARHQGAQAAAGRGLLNSSFGAGSSQAAAIKAAMPIAQQDAATYSRQAMTNQAATNQFGFAQKSAGLQGVAEANKMNQALDADFQQFNANMDAKTSMFDATMSHEANMAAQSIAAQERLTLAKLWQNTEVASKQIMAQMKIAGAQIDKKSGKLDDKDFITSSKNYLQTNAMKAANSGNSNYVSVAGALQGKTGSYVSNWFSYT